MNYNKLKGKCFEKGITIEKMCNSAGINYVSLYRRIKNDKIQCKDAQKIADYLRLSKDEIMSIFFEPDVA